MPFELPTLSQDAAYLYTYGLLGLAILSLWFQKGFLVWTLILTCSAALGVAYEVLSIKAVVVMIAYWGACYGSFTVMRPRIRLICRIITIVMTTAVLMSYYLGFNPWIVEQHLALSHRALPFTHYVFYDHALPGLMILGMGAIPLTRRYADWVILLRSTWPIAAAALLAISCVAYEAHYVDLDFKWTAYYKTWAITNLIFVCIAEEAIFRGIIQKPMTDLFQNWKFGKFEFGVWFAMFFTTGIYVLRHFYTGTTVMIFSFVTGIFYSYAYLKTRRIESCILIHFLVNSLHFLAFTYPILA